MTRGFFSIFVAGFAIVILIALLYSQSVRDDSDSHATELLIAQQELAKNWFLARNAYVNFSADAMATHAQSLAPPPACNLDPSTDYAAAITAYWNQTRAFLLTQGVDCQAVLSPQLYTALGETANPNTEVRSDGRAYGILTCLMHVGGVDLNRSEPFAIKKEVVVSAVDLSHCQVEVFDNLGATSAGVLHVGTDIDATYP